MTHFLHIDPLECYPIYLSIDTSQYPKPHAMAVSTIDEHGCPDALILILKNLDDRGWHSAANGGSPKARHIERNRNVALTFCRPDIGTQVRVRVVGGAVLGEKEYVEDIRERSLGSRVSAKASVQSWLLVRRVAEVEAA